MKSNDKSGSSTAKKRMGGTVKIVLIILAVVLVAGAAAWYFMGKTAQAKSQAQAGTITSTATVQRGDIRQTASGSGTLVAGESVNMSFSTSGKVAELNVKLGDVVKEGNVLARLENAKDLEADLASAQASLLLAQQNLSTLQKNANSTLAQAYQDLVSAQAAYNDALEASQRTAAATRCSPELVNKYKTALQHAIDKLIEQNEKDPASEAATVARYDYDTALANNTYCAAYTATEKTGAQATLEVAKAALQEAQDKYNTLIEASGIDPDLLSMNETRVETAQTMVDQAQEALDGATLKATIAGKITYLAAGEGTIVDTSTFLTISDVTNPTVTVSLDETDLDKLVVGNTAEITFTALPGKTFTGKVSVANPEMTSFGPFKAATGQVELDAEEIPTIENLPLGLSATIKITGKEANGVLYVPEAALKQLQNGDYVVERVGSDGETIQQMVVVGIQDETNAEIIDGLQEGDLVSITTKSSSNNDQGDPFTGGGMPVP